MEIIIIFVEEDTPGIPSPDRFRTCVATNEGLNSTSGIHPITPIPATLTMKILPLQLIHVLHYAYITIVVLLGANVTEAFMYLRIFQNTKRYVIV